MRIILSCLQSLKRHDIPAYDFWRLYFVEGCKEAGIQALEVPGVDWAEGLAHASGSKGLKAWRERTWEMTLAFARQQQGRGGIDFFLGYLYPNQVEPAAIRQLHHIGIPSVNFFCDNVREFTKVPEEYADFALHWVPEYEAIHLYKRFCRAYIHAPMPCWIPPNLRTLPERETEPPTFVGSADILRRNLLAQAIDLGAPVTARGRGWTHTEFAFKTRRGSSIAPNVLSNQLATIRQHGFAALAAKLVNTLLPQRSLRLPTHCVGTPVPDEHYPRILRESIVTLGINRVSVPRRPLRCPLKYSRLRDIEATMLGACYLTEHTEGLAHLYELGKEIETYRSAAEMKEKLQELMHSPKKRLKLRLAGQRKALAEHTVSASLRKICVSLGLS